MLDVDFSTAFAAAVVSDNAEYADDDEVSDGDGGGMLDED
jgi:hypothetical protein